MNDPRPRPHRPLLIGMWDAMNFTRRLVFNLLFFGLLVVLVAAMPSGTKVSPCWNAPRW
ncbi:MAG: hypothetical protein IPO74_10995 [Thermomonas sp.]|nr:hypothetical protein [Thermomonas sp.]